MMVSSHSHNARLDLVLIFIEMSSSRSLSVRDHSRSPLHSAVVPDSSSGEDDRDKTCTQTSRIFQRMSKRT